MAADEVATEATAQADVGETVHRLFDELLALMAQLATAIDREYPRRGRVALTDRLRPVALRMWQQVAPSARKRSHQRKAQRLADAGPFLSPVSRAETMSASAGGA
jgi:hypothetical protein